MKTTMTLCANFNVDPFYLMQQDIDEVITIINYYILLGETEPEQKSTTPTQKPVARKDERIKVNDATATGGWW